MNITHIVRILESYIKKSKITDKITAIIKALIVIKAQTFTTMRAILSNSIGSLSNVGVFTLRVFFGTNHMYGWCHSFCSKVEYVL